MTNTVPTMKSVTVTLTDSGITFCDLPLIVAELRNDGSEYYLFAPEVSEYDVTSDALTHDAWLFILDVVEYSINEGDDMSREILAEEGDTHPSFRYQVN